MVISHTQFMLARLRRDLQRAFQQEDWSAVERLNPLVMDAFQRASVAADRNLQILVPEVQKVASLYRQLVDASRAKTNLAFEKI